MESNCAVKSRANMHLTVRSFFYALHDEALRQSSQSQWLVIATMGRYNVLTQQAEIIDELKEIISFSGVMWEGTMENVRNEVLYGKNEVNNDVYELENCCSEAFVEFEAALQLNICQSLKC